MAITWHHGLIVREIALSASERMTVDLNSVMERGDGMQQSRMSRTGPRFLYGLVALE